MPGVEVGCCAINLEKFIEEKEKELVSQGAFKCLTRLSVIIL